MSTQTVDLTQRERELAAIIDAYNGVTERLKSSHEQLGAEVRGLREELARKNRQLRRRERLAALGELSAGVAHEIRNPLGGIRVFASLLRRDLAEQPDALRLVEKIISGVTRLERIVTDILEFGRPAEPAPERVALRLLLAEVSELAAGKRPGTKVQIDIAPDLQECCLVTDAPLLQRALLNLGINGIEAAEAGGSEGALVQIIASAGPGDRIVIEVQDNGPGIAPELLDRVFNPFFTTKDTGTGLGLAIVHQTIEAIGGTVRAGNRPEGGAVFTVCLPRVMESAVEERAGKTNRNGKSPRRAAVTEPLTHAGETSAAA